MRNCYLQPLKHNFTNGASKRGSPKARKERETAIIHSIPMVRANGRAAPAPERKGEEDGPEDPRVGRAPPPRLSAVGAGGGRERGETARWNVA